MATNYEDWAKRIYINPEEVNYVPISCEGNENANAISIIEAEIAMHEKAKDEIWAKIFALRDVLEKLKKGNDEQDS